MKSPQNNSVRKPGQPPPRKRRGLSIAREYAEVLAVITAVTVAGRFVPLSYTAFGHIYLLAVIALSLRVGRWPVMFAAVASALAWDYFFVSPRMSFAVSTTRCCSERTSSSRSSPGSSPPTSGSMRSSMPRRSFTAPSSTASRTS